MSWVRIDDHAPEHPKQLEAGPTACWLWLASLAYASRHLTDGFVPDSAVPTLGVQPHAKHAGTLVRVGLWDRVDGGYRIHDYLDYNPSREQVSKKRNAGMDRLKEWRKRKGNAHGNAVETLLQDGFTSVCNTNPVPVPVPDPKKEHVGALPRTVASEFGEPSPIEASAAWLLENYPKWYQELRGKPMRPFKRTDFDEAVSVVTEFPDRAEVEAIARIFLSSTTTRTAWATERTMAQFRATAPKIAAFNGDAHAH